MLLIDNALSRKCPQLQKETVILLREVITRLPNDILCSELPLFVAFLFPMIEKDIDISNESGDNEYIVDDIEKLSPYATLIAEQESRIPNIADKPELLLLDTNYPCYDLISQDMERFKRAAYASNFIRESFSQCKQIAIKILSSLFHERWPMIEPAITLIPKFPNNLPAELSDIVRKHQTKMSQLSFDQKIRNLCKLLKHESSRVSFQI